MKDSHDEGEIAARYGNLTVERDFYLVEGVKSAKLTIPSIMQTSEDARNAGSQTPRELHKPFQSLGARGIRNITAKLGLTLFPPTGSFFRYEVNAEFQAALENDEEASERRVELEQKLATRERYITEEFESQAMRPKIDQLLRLLITTGNALAYLPKSGGMRVFPLNNYVVRRDYTGNLIEIIYVEVLDRKTVSPDVKQALLDAGKMSGDEPDDSTSTKDKTVDLYTRVMREGENFTMVQEVDGVEVPDSKGTVKKDRLPFLALRFVAIDGEDYGRSYVEEFRGDLQSLESLQKAIVIASLNAAKIIPIINPNAAITPRKFVQAENGQPLVGLEGDIHFLQQNKHADMSVAFNTRESLRQTLSASFLLNSAFQRDAERVTAEEIRNTANELEDALGGFFSTLSVDLQLPIAQRIEEQLVRSGALKRLPKDTVQPTIVTGLAAIGRGHELDRLRSFISGVTELIPVIPEMGQFINSEELIKRMAVGEGVLLHGLLKSAEQVAEENRAANKKAIDQQTMQSGADALGSSAGAQLGEQFAQQDDPTQALQALQGGGQPPQ